METSEALFSDVRILVACNDYHRVVDSAHLDSVADFMYAASDLISAGKIAVVREHGTILDLERSKLAWLVSQPENGYTHLFMYDADMTVSIGDIAKLLSRNVDIVSGTYFMRGIKPEHGEFPCVSAIGTRYVTRDEIRNAGDSLIEVDSVGGGCLLTTASALRKIGQPAFRFDWHIGGTYVESIGEDQYFCKRAQAAGYKVYLDPTVIPLHFSRIAVGMDVSDLNGTVFYKPKY